jgi:hypothetical protein
MTYCKLGEGWEEKKDTMRGDNQGWEVVWYRGVSWRGVDCVYC